jgi:hypothetical protein
MNILLGFAPYIAFFLFMQAASIDLGLWAALIVAVLNAGRNWARSGLPKLLELGTVLLFAALAVFTSAAHWKWTVMAVRLAVDAGLLAIVLASLAAGTPLHSAVRPRARSRTILACAALSKHQSPDRLGVGWCLRGDGGDTRCSRLCTRGSVVGRSRGYDRRVSSGVQVHRVVSGARAQKSS